MGTTVVRYTTRPDRADENQALIEEVYAELTSTAPPGLRYMTFRLDDGVSFVHVASIETEDGSNPLGTTAAFAAFQRDLGDRCVAPPAVTGATLVGAHRFVVEPAEDEEAVRAGR
jgi:hypothetical protein